jgi:hypothetical protein
MNDLQHFSDDEFLKLSSVPLVAWLRIKGFRPVGWQSDGQYASWEACFLRTDALEEMIRTFHAGELPEIKVFHIHTEAFSATVGATSRLPRWRHSSETS